LPRTPGPFAPRSWLIIPTCVLTPLFLTPIHRLRAMLPKVPVTASRFRSNMKSRSSNTQLAHHPREPSLDDRTALRRKLVSSGEQMELHITGAEPQPLGVLLAD